MLAIFIAILFDCIMTFFGSMALNAGFNSYITDVTTIETRPKAMSMAQIMFLFALLVTYGASRFLITAVGYFAYFYIIGGLVLVIGLIGSLMVEDSPDLKPLNTTTWHHVKNTFQKDKLGEYKNFLILLIAMAIWETGFYIFFPFLLVYLQYYIGISIITSSILIFIAILVSIIIGYPIGLIINKIGRKKMAILSTLLIGTFLIFFSMVDKLIFLLILGTLWFLFYTGWTISTLIWVKIFILKKARGNLADISISLMLPFRW
ncbi:MAG: MFS transporter [Promethearchaeota archaeon]